MSGKDFRRNMETAWEFDGQYATDVFTNVSMDIIRSHNKSTPLFLYVAHAAVHAANIGKALEAPQEIINKFSYISDPNRRTYAGKLEHFGNMPSSHFWLFQYPLDYCCIWTSWKYNK
jgi:hypothetical protein